ncbi:organic solvent resistance ABC transporter periplasmic protein [Mycobacterium bohemicum DSM 44277]|uniref:Mammalian cell entry protein n=2 Tax=Mycobacterium bohemicum TaxID=56425 RepID=A0A1X1R169_MYCBE|nr:MlaD family protein [Mycobacterium bohemicum]MCV6969400.1 MCE family protein [Mycobacterium bohemicum]ORU97639.1 mammalian cell entry protein [Mycobacterium bohemicum]CPR13253.1 organic solvent resistance ABC transporter periplasmic protein [Mycobacterium bohemicum DSM 44277]
MPIFSDQGVRAPSSRSLRIRGLIAAVVLAVAVGALYQLGTGGYADTYKLTVVADAVGEGLSPGAEVKFRGLTIGTVKTLESFGYNKQKMTVELEPAQAKALAADTTARFMSSNTFGLAAVELISSGVGPRLRPNQTLLIGADVQSSSITGLLRAGEKLGKIVDSPDVSHIIEVLRRHADLTEPVTRSYFDLAKMLVDSQRTPFSQSLSVFASVVNGASDTIPLIKLAYDLLNGMAFLAQRDGVERTNLILDQTAKLLFKSDDLFARNVSWLVPITSSLTDVMLPQMYTLGSLAPAYDRLSGLLDRTSAAFPVIDGKVRMRVEVALEAMPGLPAALAPQPPGPPGPPAPAPRGGGR